MLPFGHQVPLHPHTIGNAGNHDGADRQDKDPRNAPGRPPDPLLDKRYGNVFFIPSDER
ncbi:MAG: hypothetical protein QF493_13575 [Rhodospirillales bacterium]|nr:hypothetical protein [Rhodospirillales bacterium]